MGENEDLKTPILLLHGTEDPADAVMACYMVHDRAGSADKRVVQVNGRTDDVWSDGENSNHCALESVTQWLAEKFEQG